MSKYQEMSEKRRHETEATADPEPDARLTKLREARDSYAVRWHDFMNKARSHPSVLHCFFEGQDAKYYGSRIRMLANVTHFIEYRCGGKPAVNNIIQLFSESDQYPGVVALFFVDRDFDDNTKYSSHTNVYLTEGYSIENYYVSKAVLTRVLSGEFGLDPLADELEINTISERLESTFSDFVDKSRDLNAWIAAVRDYEFESPTGEKLNLADHDISSYVQPSFAGNQKNYTLNDLPERFKVGAPHSNVLNRRQAQFAEADGRIVFRGKWLLEAVRKLLEELKADRRKKPPVIFQQRGRAPLQLSKSNIVSELSVYADTPESLRVFLLQFCGQDLSEDQRVD